MKKLITIFMIFLMLFLSINSAYALSQCNDGEDNDDDTLVDFPSDPDCLNENDNSEGVNQGVEQEEDTESTETTSPKETSKVITSKCSDNIDNDQDGFIDYPSDPGCVSENDNDEYNQPSSDEKSDLTGDTPDADPVDTQEESDGGSGGVPWGMVIMAAPVALGLFAALSGGKSATDQATGQLKNRAMSVTPGAEGKVVAQYLMQGEGLVGFAKGKITNTISNKMMEAAAKTHPHIALYFKLRELTTQVLDQIPVTYTDCSKSTSSLTQAKKCGYIQVDQSGSNKCNIEASTQLEAEKDQDLSALVMGCNHKTDDKKQARFSGEGLKIDRKEGITTLTPTKTTNTFKLKPAGEDMEERVYTNMDPEHSTLKLNDQGELIEANILVQAEEGKTGSYVLGGQEYSGIPSGTKIYYSQKDNLLTIQPPQLEDTTGATSIKVFDPDEKGNFGKEKTRGYSLILRDGNFETKSQITIDQKTNTLYSESETGLRLQIGEDTEHTQGYILGAKPLTKKKGVKIQLINSEEIIIKEGSGGALVPLKPNPGEPTERKAWATSFSVHSEKEQVKLIIPGKKGEHYAYKKFETISRGSDENLVLIQPGEDSNLVFAKTREGGEITDLQVRDQKTGKISSTTLTKGAEAHFFEDPEGMKINFVSNSKDSKLVYSPVAKIPDYKFTFTQDPNDLTKTQIDFPTVGCKKCENINYQEISTMPANGKILTPKFTMNNEGSVVYLDPPGKSLRTTRNGEIYIETANQGQGSVGTSLKNSKDCQNHGFLKIHCDYRFAMAGSNTGGLITIEDKFNSLNIDSKYGAHLELNTALGQPIIFITDPSSGNAVQITNKQECISLISAISGKDPTSLCSSFEITPTVAVPVTINEGTRTTPARTRTDFAGERVPQGIIGPEPPLLEVSGVSYEDKTKRPLINSYGERDVEIKNYAECIRGTSEEMCAKFYAAPTQTTTQEALTIESTKNSAPEITPENWEAPGPITFGGTEDFLSHLGTTIDGEVYSVRISDGHLGDGTYGKDGYIYPEITLRIKDINKDGTLSPTELSAPSKCGVCDNVAQKLLKKHPNGIKTLPYTETIELTAKTNGIILFDKEGNQVKYYGEGKFNENRAFAPAPPAAKSEGASEAVEALLNPSADADFQAQTNLGTKEREEGIKGMILKISTEMKSASSTDQTLISCIARSKATYTLGGGSLNPSIESQIQTECQKHF